MESAARVMKALELIESAGEVRKLGRIESGDVLIVSPKAELWDRDTTTHIALALADALDAGTPACPRILLFSRPVDFTVVDRGTAELVLGEVAGTA